MRSILFHKKFYHFWRLDHSPFLSLLFQSHLITLTLFHHFNLPHSTSFSPSLASTTTSTWPHAAPPVPDVSPGGSDKPDPGDVRQHRPVGHVDLPTGLHHLQPGLLADLPTHGSRACQRILEDEEEEPEPLKNKWTRSCFLSFNFSRRIEF